MKKISIISLLIAGVLFVSSCGSSGDGSTQLRLAHVLDPSHPVHKAMQIMADNLEEKSDGQMTMQIYPSGQLGSERESLEQVQNGQLDLTKVSSAVLENFVPEFKVFGIPYIFESEAHRFQVMEGEIGQELLESSTSADLLGLTYYDAGSRSFYTKNEPIREPSDLEGKKIRVMNSETSMQLINQLGANPQGMPPGELYTALQQGVVNGAENNPPSVQSMKHYEVCNYYSLDEHTSYPDVLLIGAPTWEGLSDQEKTWVKEAAMESYEEQKELWAEATQEALDVAKENGMEIIRPDKQPFIEATQSIRDQYKQDEQLGDLVKRIIAAGENI